MKRRADYHHAYRIFTIIAIAVGAALVVRTLLVPDSFGRHGHYRAEAMTEARAHELRHVTVTTCAECHDDVAELHAKDAHASVQCEVCHGPGRAHVDAGGDGPIRRPAGKQICLVCHELLLARPGEFAQIEVQKHYEFVGVGDPGTDCGACHDPHEPLYMDRDLRLARLHPLIHRCRDCHAGRTDRSLQRPAEHPAIFECDYCHGAVAADFQARPHSAMRCTDCHIFFRESEFAGRILRDADPRFCLLCHRETDFRSDDSAPGIAWPEHLDDVADDGEREKRCIDCHQEAIHRLQGTLSTESRLEGRSHG
jgi:hypothetical protein